MKRKIIQIAIAMTSGKNSGNEDCKYTTFIGLCDDGSVWEKKESDTISYGGKCYEGKWYRVSDIPQDDN